MKVENPSVFMIQWIHHNPKYLPERNEFSWRNYIISAAQNATTIIRFIATTKIKIDTKNINAESVNINSLQTNQ